MAFDTNLLATKLKRCRNNFELTLNEVSASSGISISKLQDIETGKVEPYGDEILILADIYQEDFKYFISNDKLSASEQVEELYRVNGKTFSKADKHAIQTFINLCDNEQFVWDCLGIQINPFRTPHIDQHYIKKSDGIRVADMLRLHMGYTDLKAYQNLYQELRKIGIHIFRMELNNSGISGLFIRHPRAGKCILINADENIYRQNFTLAHEIGHALMDGIDFNVSLSTEDESSPFREYRADAFASNFLLPRNIIRKIPKSSINADFIKVQADRFRVNVIAFLIALKEARIISDYEFDKYKQIKIPKAEQRDYEFEDLTERITLSYQTAIKRGLTPTYIKYSHKAYYDGHISVERLAEMLLTDIYDLPNLLDQFKFKLKL